MLEEFFSSSNLISIRALKISKARTQLGGPSKPMNKSSLQQGRNIYCVISAVSCCDSCRTEPRSQ